MPTVCLALALIGGMVGVRWDPTVVGTPDRYRVAVERWEESWQRYAEQVVFEPRALIPDLSVDERYRVRVRAERKDSEVPEVWTHSVWSEPSDCFQPRQFVTLRLNVEDDRVVPESSRRTPGAAGQWMCAARGVNASVAWAVCHE